MKARWIAPALIIVIALFIGSRNQERLLETPKATTSAFSETENYSATASSETGSASIFNLTRQSRPEPLFGTVTVPADSKETTFSSKAVTLDVSSMLLTGDAADAANKTEEGIPFVVRRYTVTPEEMGAPPTFGKEPGKGPRGPSAKEFLAEQGINFDEDGSTAFYVASRSEMIVRNTEENLKLVEDFMSQAKTKDAEE